MARARGRRPGPGRLEQRRHAVRRDRRDRRRAGGCRPTSRRTGPSRSRCSTRAVAAGAGAVVLTVDTPVVATSTPPATGRLGHRRPRAAAGELRPGYERRSRRREGARPRTARHRLARRPDRSAGRRQGSARPDDAAAASQAGAARGLGLEPRRRQLDRAESHRACLPAVVPRSGSAPRCTSTAGCAPGSTSWPRWPSARTRSSWAGCRSGARADGGRRGRRAAGRGCTQRPVEALRLAGCRTRATRADSPPAAQTGR